MTREEREQAQADGDLISRQAAIKSIGEKAKRIKNEDTLNGLAGAVGILFDLPSFKPQPKTGHWVEKNINEWSRKVFCSECGCPPPFEHVSNGDVYSASGYGVTNKTKYCPNCGTKMVEEQESEE